MSEFKPCMRKQIVFEAMEITEDYLKENPNPLERIGDFLVRVNYDLIHLPRQTFLDNYELLNE